jgi:ATP-dependent DNA ligase
MQIIKEKDEVQFWGRRLERKPNWTQKLSYLIPYLKELPPYTLLDCELYSEGGRRFIPSLFAKAPKTKPIIFVFDVVYLEGEFLGEKPLRERKEILTQLKLEPPFYQLDFKPFRSLEDALEKALKEGAEGIVIRELNSPYEVGRDAPIATQFWRKIK